MNILLEWGGSPCYRGGNVYQTLAALCSGRRIGCKDGKVLFEAARKGQKEVVCLLLECPLIEPNEDFDDNNEVTYLLTY